MGSPCAHSGIWEQRPTHVRLKRGTAPTQTPTVTLPLIDDNTTIEAMFVRLRDMKRGGFVLDDPKGSPVVTTSRSASPNGPVTLRGGLTGYAAASQPRRGKRMPGISG